MLKTNIKELQKDDVLLVSIDYYNANKEKLKGIPLAITPDGKPPIEPTEEELEHFEEEIQKEVDEMQVLKSRVEELEKQLQETRELPTLKSELATKYIEPIKEVKR